VENITILVEDSLSLLLPVLICQRRLRRRGWFIIVLVRLVDIVDSDDCEVAIVTEIPESNAGAGLDTVLVDGFL